MRQVETIAADYGGRVIYAPIEDILQRLTRWTGPVAQVVSSLGLEVSVNHSFIEDLARSDGSFSQAVGENARMMGRVI